MKRQGLKRGLALLAACLLLGAGLSLGGCAEREQQQNVDVDAAVQAALGAGGFTEELVALDDSNIGKYYPTLDTAALESYSCNVSGSMGTPEEVSVFRAKTADGVADIRAAVERRVEDQRISFEDYRPEEMPKIDNAVIVEKGDCVLFAVCAESDAVRDAFEKL